ncbi:MAG: hypothetical protein HW387_1229 [Parachlamydiales bacterium]|nr:hypothetical protein [Parachlamydiales bacterium]
MTTPSSGIFHDMWKGIQTGSAIMLAQTPLVTSLNRISVVSCRYDLSMLESAKQIFQGTIDAAGKPSAKHFLKGISGHLVKESARLGFKASGIVLKPRVDSYLQESPSGKLKSDLIFAVSLSMAEMLINPADTLRTMWQANEKVNQVKKNNLFSHLYKGAAANGARQFGIWLGFPLSERVWSKAVEDTTSIDPYSISGIVAKSFPQSFQVTAPVWFLERLKNELQYCPNLHATGATRYSSAFKQIIHQQGWNGFFRGFMPKLWSNTILVIGADYLLEQGRKAQKARCTKP